MMNRFAPQGAQSIGGGVFGSPFPSSYATTMYG